MRSYTARSERSTSDPMRSNASRASDTGPAPPPGRDPDPCSTRSAWIEQPAMKWIGELYDAHSGRDIYVVGTGSSLRVFPLEFLADKITIGLNQAWKFLPLTYCITSVPKFNIPELIA